MSKRFIFPQENSDRKRAKLDVSISDHNFPLSQNIDANKGKQHNFFIYFKSFTTTSINPQLLMQVRKLSSTYDIFTCFKSKKLRSDLGYIVVHGNFFLYSQNQTPGVMTMMMKSSSWRARPANRPTTTTACFQITVYVCSLHKQAHKCLTPDPAPQNLRSGSRNLVPYHQTSSLIALKTNAIAYHHLCPECPHILPKVIIMYQMT